MCFLSLVFEIGVCSLCHWGQLPIPAVSSLKSKHGLRGRLEKQTSRRLLAVALTPPQACIPFPPPPALRPPGPASAGRSASGWCWAAGQSAHTGVPVLLRATASCCLLRGQSPALISGSLLNIVRPLLLLTPDVSLIGQGCSLAVTILCGSLA